MKKSSTLLVAAAIILALSGNAQHRNSSHNKRVKVLTSEAILGISPKISTIGNTHQSFAAIAGAVIPPVLEIGKTVVKHYSEKNAKLYAASYSCYGSMDGFYKQAIKSDDGKTLESIDVYLPELKIERKIILKKKAEAKTAVELTLVPELSKDGTAFRYVLKSGTEFDYHYSIAKTIRKYDYLTVSIDIKVKSISVNKGKYEVNDLRTTNILLQNVQVMAGKNTVARTVTSGWIPLPPPTIVANPPSDKTETVETTTTKTTSPVEVVGKPAVSTNTITTEKLLKSEKKKVSEDEAKYTDTGLLEIEVTVTETNIYKVKAEEQQKLIESTSDPVSTLLNTIVEQATKSKDEESEKTDD